jgi:hypothetical protein
MKESEEKSQIKQAVADFRGLGMSKHTIETRMGMERFRLIHIDCPGNKKTHQINGGRIIMRSKTFKSVYIIVLFLMLPVFLTSQDLINGFVLEKGKGDVAIAFTHERSTQLFIGTERIDLPAAMGKYKVQSWTAYLAYGLSDNFNIVLNLPYIKATTTGAPNQPGQEEKGLQDAAVFIKWRVYYRKTGAGELSIVAAGGVTFPMSEYVPETAVSIGNRATSIDARIALLYKFNPGLFAELLGGYSLRSGEVPNAYTAGVKTGYTFHKLYIDAWLQLANSTDGTDIGDVNFITFPSTKVNYTRVGATVYYPIIPQLGIFLKWFGTLDGRNINKADSISSGFVFRF